MKFRIIALLNLISVVLHAQFPGAAGTTGSTALLKDTALFVEWGKDCKVTRGYQDISDTSLGYTTIGDSSKAVGKADADVVSLGDGGIAIITFTNPIRNGSGFDFAVFENGFNDTFLELAFVEVSSDGINYFRFPATSNLPASPQHTNGAVMDPAKVNNLAGKYRVNYGTPFDLQELTGIPQLDVNYVTHVKIIDVIGSINSAYASYDQNNNIINDPWPTAFASGGFDLDAIGVIHAAVGINELKKDLDISVFPNPVQDEFVVRCSQFLDEGVLRIFNLLGQESFRAELESNYQSFDVSHLEQGVYYISLENKKGSYTTRLLKN
jgi:hypothetical protein